MMKKRSYTQLLLFLTLLLASIVATTMIVLRAWYSGRLLYTFLLWNLFLAWLPFLFAWTAYRKPFIAAVYGPLWLLFFPNAPYLVTDLIHLRHFDAVPIWYDAIMLFTFALTGLMLGFLSLYMMQSLVARRLGRIWSWLFVVAAVGMSSYGVYVGRFLRWNSWDIFRQPVTLLADIANSLFNPAYFLKTYTVSFSLSAVMLFAYIVMVAMPHLGASMQVASDE
ncbi:MAG: DUF1361 domain-containing protein [Ardenticatenaceae bacterium]|nr:DUF1361 domain-containing protein [Ardenticatenaceae bacterium]